MDQTARFAMPLLAPGQSQKEWFHNEALQTIDALLCAMVEGPPVAQPPASPAEGQCFIIASGGSGAWAGKDGNLAAFTEGGWKFIAPSEGLRALDRASGQTLLRRNGGWESGIVRAQEVRIGGQLVVRERQPAVAAPTGGTTVDAECRSAVAALLAALQAHGLIG
jgi:hypothetical protein